jgi:tRNA dimethylallyltransferase
MYVVAGPTASGKSSYAIQLAKEINGYIINADSKQVYKEISIGTAKPTPDEIRKDGSWLIDGVEHYLYGHVSINEEYNLYKYQKDVYRILKKKFKSDPDVTPILVGGTGLYIDAVIHNYELQKTKILNKGLRGRLEKLSLPQLQMEAGELIRDLNESDLNNPIRLIRLIERGGKYEKGETLDHKYIVIDLPKKQLNKKIEERVDEMFSNGLLEENMKLVEDGYSYDLTALRTLGYQEFKEYFNGNKSLDEVKQDIITHTKQYAKRQRTWFRKKV